MTISTERVRQYATDEFMFAADDVRAMARELLAVREARSIGFIQDQTSGHDSYVLKAFYGANLNIGDKVYTAPPAPAVPAELLYAMAEVIRISDRDHEAWDRAKAAISACRAAMLNHVGDSNEKAEHVSQGYTLPEGYKLVPVEPTENMVIDGFESEAFEALADAVQDEKGWPYSCRESAECVTGIFKAMLAAAPTPTKPEAGK